MANSEMGEVAVVLRGEEHVLCFDLNGVLALCEHFGVESIDQLDVMGEELVKPLHLRFVVAVALRGGSLPDCTEDQAGRLVPISCLGDAMKAVTAAFAAATKSLESAAKEADPDPPVKAAPHLESSRSLGSPPV